jgi:hypothetical protein
MSRITVAWGNLPWSAEMSPQYFWSATMAQGSPRFAMRAVREMATGRARISDVLSSSDLNWNTSSGELHFLLEVEIAGESIYYAINLSATGKAGEFVVAEEYLQHGIEIVFHRDASGVAMRTFSGVPTFPVDSGLLALPIIQEETPNSPVAIFRRWLTNLVIISPVPELIQGESSKEATVLSLFCDNLADWYRGVALSFPEFGGEFIRYFCARSGQIWEPWSTRQPVATARA